MQLEICREQVEWARTEKRTFLRQRIEARLANLLLQMGDYSGALALIGKLLTEVWGRQRKRSIFLAYPKVPHCARIFLILHVLLLRHPRGCRRNFTHEYYVQDSCSCSRGERHR